MNTVITNDGSMIISDGNRIMAVVRPDGSMRVSCVSKEWGTVIQASSRSIYLQLCAFYGIN